MKIIVICRNNRYNFKFNNDVVFNKITMYMNKKYIVQQYDRKPQFFNYINYEKYIAIAPYGIDLSQYLDLLKKEFPRLIILLRTNKINTPLISRAIEKSELRTNETAICFTDGSFDTKTKNGAWGAVIKYNNCVKRIFGIEKQTTSVKLELIAILKALEYTKGNCIIYTDSKISYDGINNLEKWKENNWKKNKNSKISNIDLYLEIYKYIPIKIKFIERSRNTEANRLANNVRIRSLK